MGTRNTTPKAYKYVKNMLNVTYLTGFVSEINRAEGWFKVAQTVNPEHDIVIYMEPGDARIPSKRRAITATCHIRGEKIDDPKNKQDKKLHAIRITAIDISQANVLNIPAPAAYFGKARARTKLLPKNMQVSEERNPYDDKGNLKQEIAQSLQPQNVTNPEDMMEVIRKIIETTGGKLNTSLGQNANVTFVAGCVENAFIRQANEFSPKDRLEIILRQTENVDECLIVRYEPDTGPAPQAYASRIKKGFPIKILGEIRVKLIQDEEGNILGHHCYIRAREIYSAEMGKDIQSLPVWWIEKSKQMGLSEKREAQDLKLEELIHSAPERKSEPQIQQNNNNVESNVGW